MIQIIDPRGLRFSLITYISWLLNYWNHVKRNDFYLHRIKLSIYFTKKIILLNYSLLYIGRSLVNIESISYKPLTITDYHFFSMYHLNHGSDNISVFLFETLIDFNFFLSIMLHL